jgi:hypothetical protein
MIVVGMSIDILLALTQASICNTPGDMGMRFTAICRAARVHGCGVGTVQRIKRTLLVGGELR